MTPIVLIATHARVDITTRNIQSLLNQSIKPVICIICDEEDVTYYREIYPRGKVFVSYEDNMPLGNKWQHGVSLQMNANPLIITGSDDILGDGFIENACRLIKEGNHFIGLRRWWQHKDGKAYYCQYMANYNMPLGGGRCYSGEMLKKIDYEVFDIKANKHLDELGWNNARQSGLKCLVLDEPEKEGLSIHAIKGNWPVLNKFTLKHPNLRVLKAQKSTEVLTNFQHDQR